MKNINNELNNSNIWQNINVLVHVRRWHLLVVFKNLGKIMRALHGRNANIYLYCAPFTDKEIFYKFFPKVNVLEFPDEAPVIKKLTVLTKTIINNKIDIVLWTYSGYEQNIILPILKLIKGLYYVIKCDSYTPKQQYKLIRKIRKFFSVSLFTKFPGKFADFVLVESRKVENYYRNLLKTNNIIYFPNGVSLKYAGKLEKEYKKENSPVKNPFILYVGAVSYLKGTDLLIKSFGMIKEKIGNWELHIVGPIEDKDYYNECLKLISERRLENKIFFRLLAMGRELYRWYYFAEFFVLPSRIEGSPNCIPEAMFFKNPIIAFDVGQNRNLVTNETGIIVPERDVKAFSQAILKMIEDKNKRKKMGEISRKIVEENYNDDVLIPCLLKQCEKILLKKQGI